MYFCPRSVEPDFGLANLPYGYQNLPQTDICILVFQHNPFQVPNWLKIFSKHSFCTVHTLLSILPLFFSLLIYSLLNRKEHLSNTQELSEHQIIFPGLFKKFINKTISSLTPLFIAPSLWELFWFPRLTNFVFVMPHSEHLQKCINLPFWLFYIPI